MFKYYIMIFSSVTRLSCGLSAVQDGPCLQSIVVVEGAELLPTRIVNGLAKLHTTYAISASHRVASPSPPTKS